MVGKLEKSGELRLRLHNGGCALTSLHIFAAEVQGFTGLRLEGKNDQEAPFQLCLYFEVHSGPGNFWVNCYKSSGGLAHVLRSQAECLDLGSAPCTTSNEHFDLSATDAAGLCILVSWGLVDYIGPIPHVYSEELRSARPSEFKAFGPDARRLLNLPRLLDSLFNSAGGELMGQKPNVARIIAKLRFIKRCAGGAPDFSGLIQETNTLLDRLELPRSFPHSPEDELFFVPDLDPQALAKGMDATIMHLIDANRSLESTEGMRRIRTELGQESAAIMESVGATVGTAVTELQLDEQAKKAVAETVIASNKMDDLRKYERELKDAVKDFEDGMDKYKKKMATKMWTDLALGLGEIGFSIGVAICTGGAGAPLTIGAVNKVLKGVKIPSQGGALEGVSLSPSLNLTRLYLTGPVCADCPNFCR